MNQNRMTREAILSEIRRTALENGDVALGKKRFLDATGIAESDWSGRYWTRWSDAVAEAGFVAQSMNPRLPDVDVIEAAASIVRSLGHFPTAAEIRLAAYRILICRAITRFGGSGDSAAFGKLLFALPRNVPTTNSYQNLERPCQLNH
jgi:hypothetical protein